MRVGVVGAGWAALAAALTAARAGHRVVLWESSTHAGGRARSLPDTSDGLPRLDCGQHILIGAYAQCLTLMREVGVDTAHALHRMPLMMVDPCGQGLRLRPGHPVTAFLGALLRARHWSVADRLALGVRLARWRLAGFTCPREMTVSDLCTGLPPRLIHEFMDPLCVAALNTPFHQASAQVFLRVLHDGLFGGPGASDLLVPRLPLHDLLPGPALAHLMKTGHEVRLARRVQALEAVQGGWRLEGETVDRVIVATPATEAARLISPHDPAWASQARALRFEPILTVTLQWPGIRMAAPMVALPPGSGPAQFAFDLGALGHPLQDGVTLVASAAAAALEPGVDAAAQTLREQALATLGAPGTGSPRILKAVAERRATFLCTPDLKRPTPLAAGGRLAVAGDYVEGPYPATLEGAVRSGVAAARQALRL